MPPHSGCLLFVGNDYKVYGLPGLVYITDMDNFNISTAKPYTHW
jgi:hypothetical protein